MRHRTAALISAVVAASAAALAAPAPALAVVPGTSVRLQLPSTFEAGAQAQAVTAVVSADSGRNCRKVRWSMIVRVDGVDVNQIRLSRFEEDQEFPFQVRQEGDAASFTDVRLDPGSLCPGRSTVTATYGVAFTGGSGTVTFEARAFGADNELIQAASSTSEVVGGDGPAPGESEAPGADPSAEPSEEPVAEESGAPAGAEQPPPAQNAAANAGQTSLLGPGLIVGALLVFLGVGLLLRLRSNGRGRGRSGKGGYPTSVYPAP